MVLNENFGFSGVLLDMLCLIKEVERIGSAAE